MTIQRLFVVALLALAVGWVAGGCSAGVQANSPRHTQAAASSASAGLANRAMMCDLLNFRVQG